MFLKGDALTIRRFGGFLPAMIQGCWNVEKTCDIRNSAAALFSLNDRLL